MALTQHREEETRFPVYILGMQRAELGSCTVVRVAVVGEAKVGAGIRGRDL